MTQVHVPSSIDSAVQAALQLRRQEAYGKIDALCAFDLAEKMGIEVRIEEFASLEGMYVHGRQNAIIVSSLRPRGRRHYTCAHEIGHHVLGHGTTIDEYVEESRLANNPMSEEDRLAQTFAGFLLMPPIAVKNAFAIRGWSTSSPTPSQIFAIASWFGVGYDSLLSHLLINFRELRRNVGDRLRRFPVKDIKTDLLNKNVPNDIVVVDQHWHNRVADIETGDHLLLPPRCRPQQPGLEIIEDKSDNTIMVSVSSGVTQVLSADLDWAVFVRSARRGFHGRAIYRHMEE